MKYISRNQKNNKSFAFNNLTLAIALSVAAINAQATDVAGGETITADDITGLIADPFGGGGPITVTIESDAEGDGLSLGEGPSATGTPAIATDAFGPLYNFTINVDDAGAGTGVIFEGDVVVGDPFTPSTITINAIDDDIEFQGNVTGNVATPVDINLGSGAGSTVNMTIDTANNEDLLIDALIDASALADTVNLSVTNTDGGMNGVTFGQAIGSSFALDAISIGNATNVIFSDTVNIGAGNITFSGSGAGAFAGDVTGNLFFVSGNTAQALLGSDVGLTGSISTQTTGEGAVFFDPAFSNTTLVSGTIGSATLELLAVNVASGFTGGVVSTFGGRVDAQTINIVGGPGTITFSDIVDATTINVDGLGITNFEGNVTSNLVFANGNSATVNVDSDTSLTGNVTTATAGEGTLNFAAPSGNFTLINGNIGATNNLSAVNVATAGGFTSTFGGTVGANSINISGTGIAEFSGNATGTINFTGAATANIDADQRIIGSVTTSINGQGTLDFDQTTADTQLVSGNIGTNGARLSTINIDVNSGVDASFGGNIFANAISINGNTGGIASFDGDVTTTTMTLSNDPIIQFTGSNFTGNLVTATDNTGELQFAGTNTVNGLLGDIGGNKLKSITINSGTTTFSNNLAAHNFAVNSGATFRTSSAITANAQTGFTNSGILSLSDTLTLTGGGTAELGGSVSSGITLLSPSYTGSTVINATAMSQINTSNAITVTPHAGFTSGSLILVDTNAGAGSANDIAKYNLNVSDTMSVDYEVLVDANSDVILAATARSGGADNADLVAELNEVFNKTSSNTEEMVASVKKLIKYRRISYSATSTYRVSSSDALSLAGGPSAGSSQEGTTSAKFSTREKNETIHIERIISEDDVEYKRWGGKDGAEATKEDIERMRQESATKMQKKNADVLKAREAREKEKSDGKKEMLDTLEETKQLQEKQEKQKQKPNGTETGTNGGSSLFVDSTPSVWGRLSVGDTDKDGDNGSGYDANIESFTLGLTNQTGRTKGLLSLGFSLSYSNTDMDYNTGARDNGEIEMYMASVSGSHNIGDKAYQLVDWGVGVGRSDTTTQRLSSNNLIAKADYNSDVFFANISYSIPMGYYGWLLIPKATLSWVRVDNEGYTETGANTDNLAIGGSEIDTFTTILGSVFTREFKLKNGTISPVFSFDANYDLDTDNPNIRGGLADNAARISGKGGTPERLTFDYGLGIGYTSKDGNQTINFNYQGQYREDYENDSFSLSYNYKF